ncbi:MAG: hypothetical protein HPM95_19530 [Alphaproteobacteria bacterium]|nr:hypothetical protein [Alphaproteobacteria bacterium]
MGKSTLFNALTKTAAAQAAELSVLHDQNPTPARSRCRTRASMTSRGSPVGQHRPDPADLRRHRRAGARRLQGEGLGNQFLANIREVDAIAHVLRCFEDDDITHVDGRIDRSPTPRRSRPS